MPVAVDSLVGLHAANNKAKIQHIMLHVYGLPSTNYRSVDFYLLPSLYFFRESDEFSRQCLRNSQLLKANCGTWPPAVLNVVSEFCLYRL